MDAQSQQSQFAEKRKTEPEGKEKTRQRRKNLSSSEGRRQEPRHKAKLWSQWFHKPARQARQERKSVLE